MSTTLRASDGTAYDVTGPKGAPLVVLIHGLGLARGIWDPFLPALSGFRVLRYDLYGHGESGPVPETATLSLYAVQIAGLLDALGEDSAHIVGFSIGGMINRRFALDFPDRVASLVILNSPHDRGEAGQTAVEARAAQVREAGGMSTLPAALRRWFTAHYLDTGSGPEQVTKWREMVEPESYAQAAWVLAHGVRELIAPRPPVVAPTLIVTCENDSGSTPDMSRSIQAEIRGAECHVVARLQHLGLMEDPKAFLDHMVPFLERAAR